MSVIKIGSMNCRGLASDKVKRRDIFCRCRAAYDISILVDTHCAPEKENQWLTEWGYKGHFSSLSSTSRGVAILFKNSFEYKVHREIKDKRGNFLILDISISGHRFTLVGIYGPNDDDPNFFKDLETKILFIDNSSVIAVGDWNIVLDYEKDTFNYQRQNNPKSQKRVHEMMDTLDLHDIWRIHHTDVHRYTWRGPYLKQSRLDFFLVSSDIEGFVTDSDIQVSYRSDHSPIVLKLQFHDQQRGPGTWKFNNSLLYDTEYIQKVKNIIDDIIYEYSNISPPPENIEDTNFSISYQLLWETIKMKIRGMTISYTSHKKKDREAEEKRIENLLSQKYTVLDENPIATVKDEVLKLENELQQLREKKIRGIITRAKVKWGAEGEKGTRYFCNLEKRHFMEKIIPKLLRQDQSEISDIKSIIDEQKKFYQNLYSTSNPIFNSIHENLFFDSDNPFIQKADEFQKIACEGELSYQECLIALKNMKNNRSPGLDGFTT